MKRIFNRGKMVIAQGRLGVPKGTNLRGEFKPQKSLVGCTKREGKKRERKEKKKRKKKRGKKGKKFLEISRILDILFETLVDFGLAFNYISFNWFIIIFLRYFTC